MGTDDGGNEARLVSKGSRRGCSRCDAASRSEEGAYIKETRVRPRMVFGRSAPPCAAGCGSRGLGFGYQRKWHILARMSLTCGVEADERGEWAMVSRSFPWVGTVDLGNPGPLLGSGPPEVGEKFVVLGAARCRILSCTGRR